jgi:hypothetical protein
VAFLISDLLCCEAMAAHCRPIRLRKHRCDCVAIVYQSNACVAPVNQTTCCSVTVLASSPIMQQTSGTPEVASNHKDQSVKPTDNRFREMYEGTVSDAEYARLWTQWQAMSESEQKRDWDKFREDHRAKLDSPKP